MRLIQIDYFLALAEEKNFSHAAKKLFISQPALSKQIKLMEEEIGTLLFNRTSSGVFLTEAGEKLEMDLRKIKAELDSAILSASLFNKNNSLSVRIGCFDGLFVDDFLPKLLTYIESVHPAAKINVVRNDIEKQKKNLLDNNIDILCSLYENWMDAEQFQHVILARRKAAIIYSDKLFKNASTPEKIEDFFKYTFLAPHKKAGSNAEQLLRNYADNKLCIEYIENIQTAITNISLGLGYAVLAEGLSHEIPNVHSFPLSKEFDTLIYGVWKKEHPFMKKLMKSYRP